MVLLRLVPLVPYTALNYLAGLTALRPAAFVVGTIVGMAPGTAAMVGLGAYGSERASAPFVAAAVGLVALTGLGAALVRASAARCAPPEPTDA